MEILFTLWLFSLVTVPIFLFQSWKSYKRKKELEEVAVSKIRFAASGKVSIQGYVWPYKIIISPLNLDNIVYFSLSFYEVDNDSEFDHFLFEYKSSMPFFILDDTGLVMVNDFSKMKTEFIRETSKLYSKVDQKSKDHLYELMIKNNAIFDKINFDRIRVVEQSIIMSQPIIALGVLSKNSSVLGQIEKYAPVEGLEQFYQTIFGKYKSIKVKPDPKALAVYGSLNGTVEDELYIAPCTEEEVLSNLGDFHYLGFIIGLVFYLVLSSPIIFFVYSFLNRK